MYKQILNQIRDNKRFDKIIRLHEVLSNKYGNIVIAGGSLADCYFDKDFYDVDVFISVDDLNEQYRKEYTSKNHILDVLRDTVDNEAIDIIVVDYSVEEHIMRFDQNFKKIWYDGKLHIAKSAVDDIKDNIISLGSFNGPVVYFRCIKSSMKYNMKINEDDLFLMINYISTIKNLKVANKYKDYLKYFTKSEFIDVTLAKKMRKYSKLYWDTNVETLQSFRSFKKTL